MDTILRLPAEIRNRVYHAYLQAPQDVVVIHGQLRNGRQPALLQSCKQTRREALQLFYANNAFTVVIKDSNSAKLLVQWLNAIGSVSASAISQLTIIIDSDDWVATYLCDHLDPKSGSIAWDAVSAAIVNSRIKSNALRIQPPNNLEERILSDWSEKSLTACGGNDVDMWLTSKMVESAVARLRELLHDRFAKANP